MLTVEQAREYDRRIRAIDRASREASRDDVLRAIAPGQPSSPPSIAASLGGARARRLNLLRGTFTRSTEGFYQTQALTNGNAPAGAWAGVNEIRIEDRGDGLGPMVKLEGARTNVLGNPREMNGGSPAWQAGGASTVTTLDDGRGVDGAQVADRSQSISTEFGKYQGPFSPTNGQIWTASFYARRRAGAGADEAHYAVQDGVLGTGTYKNTPITEIFARYEATRTIAASGSVYYVPAEGRATGGLSARALDYVLDLHQLEQGTFPSSPIRTTATRDNDTLTFATGAYDARLLTRGARITVALDATDAELVASGDQMTLLATDNQAFFHLQNTAGQIKARLVAQNLAKVTTGALTFARGALLTFTMRPNDGTVEVAGCLTGNGTTIGTACTWDAGTLLRVGSLNSSGAERLFGRVGKVEIL